MTRTPEPKPALRRADDGSVHPAAPRAEPSKHLHAAPTPTAPTAVPPPPSDKTRYKPGDLRARKAAKTAEGTPSGKPKKDELVALKVSIPKKLRKATRRKAEADEVDVDAVVADALAAWVFD